MATMKMNQDWRRLRDRIKQMWSEEDFDDQRMKKTRGSLRQMVTLIREKTGESRADIRRKVVACL